MGRTFRGCHYTRFLLALQAIKHLYIPSLHRRGCDARKQDLMGADQGVEVAPHARYSQLTKPKRNLRCAPKDAIPLFSICACDMNNVFGILGKKTRNPMNPATYRCLCAHLLSSK